MKKLFLYGLIGMTFFLGSCKKFLAEYSQDEMRPGSTEDLTALMYSEAYPAKTSLETFDVLTDDVQNNPLVSVNGMPIPAYLTLLQTGTAMYTFDKTMFDQNNKLASGADSYSVLYVRIKGCNVIMDYIDKVKGTAVDKKAILGQCLLLRSYYYMKLITLYGAAYSAPGIDPETSLGVPLILESQVKDGGVSRSTLKEVYDQIERDLIKSELLLKDNYSPSSLFRVSSDLANALLCRFYLYRGLDSDWDKVIQYANLSLEKRSTLTALTTFFNSAGNVSSFGLYNSASPEMIWISTSTFNTSIFPITTDLRSLPPYTVSNDLTQLYDKGTGTSNYGDLRYLNYFQFSIFNGSRYAYATAKQTLNSGYGSKGFRVAELYLNRAEAHIRKLLKSGNESDRLAALEDLNRLRQSRYDTRNTVYLPVNIIDAAPLYQFYQQERRRELALEDGHRFLDLKRWGLGVTHVYTGLDDVSTTFALPANSPLYALPIPYTATLANLSIVQNPR
ncbi:RagB/SusD family nutrient uptake outer membrane protein [Pedobacter sp. MC2016-24]|uniref:RagB/SusD family nutrient uptake outer membrane protein n=1 Tax=Pedobacter sp. MC2016-24 TaxID=2780090 RepID=UPI001882B331|nr:RagB/SusD family nutrient uptake outer membrane protein [Pedobacter sp. MC2016-24]MBE9601546.1 RagB/SusD family nutrient uptake outer membrane protein [Pedobacter sp. MC2016-24]